MQEECRGMRLSSSSTHAASSIGRGVGEGPVAPGTCLHCHSCTALFSTLCFTQWLGMARRVSSNEGYSTALAIGEGKMEMGTSDIALVTGMWAVTVTASEAP
jgi:hypothetical protein